MSKQTDVSKLTFEEARDELAGVVQTLESGGHTLEASLALWERGELLAAHCEQWLESARTRLTEAEASSSE
ncbi:MAG: exodeoxyribonuclease VII small subunit [Candidatus Nanopelagicales bacterium]